MVALGLVLLVLAVLLAVGIVLDNGDPVEASAFGVSLDNVSVGGLFLAGLVVGVVAMIGLGLILVGAARKRHKKVAVKREVRSVKSEAESLAEENARLQAELERSTMASTTAVPPSTGSGTTHTSYEGSSVEDSRTSREGQGRTSGGPGSTDYEPPRG